MDPHELAASRAIHDHNRFLIPIPWDSVRVGCHSRLRVSFSKLYRRLGRYDIDVWYVKS
jgi:hypothetical protein